MEHNIPPELSYRIARIVHEVTRIVYDVRTSRTLGYWNLFPIVPAECTLLSLFMTQHQVAALLQSKKCESKSCGNIQIHLWAALVYVCIWLIVIGVCVPQSRRWEQQSTRIHLLQRVNSTYVAGVKIPHCQRQRQCWLLSYTQLVRRNMELQVLPFIVVLETNVIQKGS